MNTKITVQNVRIDDRDHFSPSTTLFGMSGGQLEFVGMTTTTRYIHEDRKWRKFVVLKFTDHDLQVVANRDLKKIGMKDRYYELTFPISDY